MEVSNQGGEPKVWRAQFKNQEEDMAEERITEKSRLKCPELRKENKQVKYRLSFPERHLHALAFTGGTVRSRRQTIPVLIHITRALPSTQ